MFEVPLHVTGDKQIQPAVIVVVEKTGRHRPSRVGNTGFGSNVAEGAIAAVAIQHVSPVTGDVEVSEAVVIVVRSGYAHAVVSIARRRESGGEGYIGIAAVFVLTVEAIPVAL